ncbi:uncharacterized protein LOC115354208 [Myripristis murdjan]|uniref:uncharacterized protein LOC115354208 n=1 Tax=Myripristis murdjan TaxID=586833 RepID=UPI0011764255|nr:uncharacterized protein LOC115354208 [Myripristis murdjan]
MQCGGVGLMAGAGLGPAAFIPVAVVGGAALVYGACKVIDKAADVACKVIDEAADVVAKEVVNLTNDVMGRCCKNLSSESGKSFQQQQQDGDLDSSEVENMLFLGQTGTYAFVKRNLREFSKGEDGDKGLVEADHIPPLESIRRAAEQPGFQSLHRANRGLYNMVMSLRADPRGENLFTVQVARHHHRDALSTGASRASREARLLLSRSIARGDALVMLKQAFIIAHPYASQQIRDDAALGNRSHERRVFISRDRTMRIYTTAFHSLLVKYRELDIINDAEFKHLIEYVNNCGYLDRRSPEYIDILDIVKRYGKPQN